MAGNHVRTRPNLNRTILTGFVAMVVYSTFVTWQPPSRTLRLASTPPTRLSHQLALLEAGAPPAHAWQHLAPQFHVASAVNNGAWVALEAETAELFEAQLNAMLMPGADRQLAQRDSVEWLLTPAKPAANTLAQFAFLRQLNPSHPAWLLVGGQGQAAWSKLPSATLEHFRGEQEEAQPAITEQRFASPPSLLYGPALTGANERLAMIPRSQPVVELKALAAPLDQQVVAAMRPWLAEGLQSALDRPQFAQPNTLVALLKELALEPQCAQWAMVSLSHIELLTNPQSNSAFTVVDNLERLANLSEEAEQLAAESTDPALATKLRRARYAMWRRVEIWHAVANLATPVADRIALVDFPTSGNRLRVSRVSLHSQVAVDQLLREVEQYESQPTAANGELLAIRLAQLSQSGSAGRQELSEALSDQYKNANARIALTDDLVNRFLPRGQAKVEPVSDRVLGTPVSGRAITETSASVTLLPDPNAWRLGLEITGNAQSQTVAFERTVRVRTNGSTNFAARQQLVIDSQGMHLGRVVADANSVSRFVNARSEYDAVPLLGGFIRGKAADGFAERRGRAQNQVSAKAEDRVQQEVTRATREAVDRATKEWESRVVMPLAMGGVSIEPVEMLTTDERVVARVRVAHGNGLTSLTPRPQAPSDSLASAQLHQSAFTNLVSGMKLAGEHFTAEDFAAHIRQFAPHLPVEELDADSREAEIEFAEGTPITFELVDGKMHVAMQVKELKVRGRANRDFTVHMYYTPKADGLVARFNYQAGPYLEGKMSNAQRMRLQTIFGKVFPNDGYVAVGGEYASDARLRGLMITQMVIDDGWLSIAIGPEAADRTVQLDRYAPVWK
jgi:hypothetical protein